MRLVHLFRTTFDVLSGQNLKSYRSARLCVLILKLDLLV